MSINNTDMHVTSTSISNGTISNGTITDTCFGSTCYKNFVSSVNPIDMEIRSLTVRDSVLKGRFNWLDGEVLNKMSGKINKTFMLLRGDAVAILVLIANKSQNYILVTEQLRVPTGGIRQEAIAGMMDDDGVASGVAIKEMEEEHAPLAPLWGIARSVRTAARAVVVLIVGKVHAQPRALFFTRLQLTKQRDVIKCGRLGGQRQL